jgi:hypothetical protein
LSWLWKPWFFEFGIVDLGIQSFVKEKLTIVNIGNKPVPLFVDIEYKDGGKKQIAHSAKIWASGNRKFDVKIPDYIKVKKISINRKIADCNQIDNYYPSIKELTSEVQLSENIYGNYKSERLRGVINILKVDGLIYIVIKEYGVKLLLYPFDKSTLSTLDENWKIIFLLDESGAVTGLEINGDNSKFEAKKL